MSRARWNVQYHQRVLATDPIAYWLLDEKQGAVAYDRVSGRVAGAQNGTHIGVTLGQPGIGDGRTSTLYDGANDYTDIFSAVFSAAFNGSEGSVLMWSRVANAGVWTDGVNRRALAIGVDANNSVELEKFNPNLVLLLYRAGGVTRQVITATTTTDWFSSLLTWSAAADEVRGYFNGAQSGVTLNGLGVWAGAPLAGRTIIGAVNAVPQFEWDGWLYNAVVWNRALSPAEGADLGALR